MSYTPNRVNLVASSDSKVTSLSVASSGGKSSLVSQSEFDLTVVDNTIFKVISTGGVSSNGPVSVSTSADISNNTYSLNTIGGSLASMQSQINALIQAVNSGFNLSIV